MITSADVMRLSRFPAIRREFSDALVQQPIAAEITPSRVWFGLKNRAAFHPALFTLAHPDGKTTLVIGTPKAKVLKPAALASFLRRMGWTGGRWTRVLGNKGHRDLVYQLRKANIIGGSETVAVLVPRQRVERVAGKYMRGSVRATGTNPDELSRLKRDRERVVRVMERPMSPRVFQQLMAEVARLNRAIGRLEGRPVNVNRNPRKISPKLQAAVRAAERECGDILRVMSIEGDVVTLHPVPSSTLFVRAVETVMREHGYGVRWFDANPRRNPLTDRESATVIREARRQYGYARKAKGRSKYDHGLHRGYALGLLEVGRRFGFASPKAQKAGEHVIQQAMKNPAAKKSRRNVPRRNPILATLGIAANPNPKVQNINIPFRDGQKVTTAQIERWIKTLPNGPLRTMYEARFGMGQKQYKRFHLGSVVKTWTWKTVPVGANKRITDVDFVVSEGKEWSAAYQVPPHSKKYTKDTQGRYLHAHGDSGIDIKTIKHPAKPSKLPERFHTADGLFVGVIPKKGSITDWYRH